MADLAFTPAERIFLEALEELGVSYLIVGLSAAVLQGADTVTVDVDLWFADRTHPGIGEAARRAGGVWVPASFGMMPPMLGGAGLGWVIASTWCSRCRDSRTSRRRPATRYG